MFDRLLHACDAARAHEPVARYMAMRNRAILWVLWDTGVRVSELRDLRLWDVDDEQHAVWIRGGEKERGLPLSPDGWDHLLTYLEQSRPTMVLQEKWCL